MNLIVPNLSITNFRSFRKLDIGPFGRVNLITGKNNAGKSSLLEAIRILVDGSLWSLISIIKYRQEIELGSDERKSQASIEEDVVALLSLFFGFPTPVECKEPFTINAKSELGDVELSISMSIKWYSESLDLPDKMRPMDQDRFGEPPGFPVLEIKQSNQETKLIRISQFGREYFGINFYNNYPRPCAYLNGFSSQTTGQFGRLWDGVSLTRQQEDVLHAMQMISPDIQALGLVESRTGTRSRIAIAKSKNFEKPIPLRNFGDGVSRIFGLIVTLTGVRGGVLLVDEIENGFHYSILPDVWRAVFRLASSLNVQVFATTHNWDCIEAFQIAASEHPEEGVLARLTVKDDQVIPTLFREDELRIITRDRIEVR